MLAAHSNKSAEWFTPEWLVETARHVLGIIHTDPASCEAANQTVKAVRYYSENGQDVTRWDGNVFLNPPGCKSGKLVKEFWKVATEYRGEGAVFWVGFNLNQLAVLQPSPINFTTCILRKRVAFVPGNGQSAGPSHHSYVTLLNGSVLQYARFEKLFQFHGVITK